MIVVRPLREVQLGPTYRNLAHFDTGIGQVIDIDLVILCGDRLSLAELEKLCDILGIITEKEEELLDSDIEALIEERQQARKAKNYARADEIRNELLEKGIILEDTRQGVKWKRA